ncbi:outer membrane lipid asymmetry maintenance protein MlaD [Candidatus Macondimonas diazotrophica]|jgi:phospholipid/cholesterol/gamma-HCH transport system substrate-binding protein|uniref:Outer membrane lipid asymmetry maintenance protein MlaD n=1 Tax=Candidatus Macondimonas diazotrophica TaxID=2305248 RepID=A0A4Z0FB38_9GAMM|nr:outer membrane lipid asymmetry maintenance protein MlaD [Candidatus Macondimonas diazotrophica]NCU01257.1 outer membrane lipid asymmetry maintenance protein MlaD [Candidatus Macondimonas diazotrophica]TFZ82905.1 outer membrane lipid asymmetry maintenance protein MlaD [Candidatus Macondimonas diazotrophica]HBG50834.1 outer membrane lipid asymmetry maintenance protein MlaD [Gammaproteobacteria bacterium]
MNQTRLMELVVGLFICLGLAAIFLLTLQVSTQNDLRRESTYSVQARFDNVGSLRVRAPVTLAGVRIGRVTAVDVNPETFQAEVKLAIDERYNQLPTDSSAAIQTAGILGEQYVALQPGGSMDNLKNGDRISFTQSAIVLENLIGRFLTQMGNDPE